MKTYLTKDNIKKTLKVIYKIFYYCWWIPARYYFMVTVYGKVRPSYQGAQVMMSLDKIKENTSKKAETKEYKEFLKQKQITEDYYNTLQKLKEQNQ